MRLDASGNIYVGGYFNGTADFDPSPTGTANMTSSGYLDGFLAKYDANGNYIWAIKLGGAFNSDVVYSIDVDAAGDVYVAGTFSGTVDFDPSPTNTVNRTRIGNIDMYVAKYTSAGNYSWVVSMGSYFSNNYIGKVKADGFGNVYLTGSFYSSVDFDPSPTNIAALTAASGDIFIAKYNATNGNYIWAKSMGGTSSGKGYAIDVDVASNIYVTGHYRSTVDFDPSITGTANLTAINTLAGGSDIFLAKYDSSGKYIWAKSMGGLNYDQAASLAVDASGNIYTTGIFEGTAAFDSTSTLVATGSDAFISKHDSTGHLLWVKQLGGSGSDAGMGVGLDKGSGVYVSGYFSNTADLNAGSGVDNYTSAGGPDAFVAKYNTSGNYVWAKTWGGTVNDLPVALAVDSFKNIYTNGIFMATVNFDPGFPGNALLTANAYTDFFLLKFGADSCTPEASIVTDSICSSQLPYNWMGQMITTGGMGIAQNISTNAAGCDSVITLNLIVTSTATPTVTITITPGNIVSAGTSVRFDAVAINAGTSPIYQWKKNGGIISTTTSYTTNSLAEGDAITCTVTANNPCVTMNIVQSDTIIMHISTSAGSANSINGSILLYPNQNNGHFNVKGTGLTGKTAALEVMNAIGQTVYHRDEVISNGSLATTFYLPENSAPGIYFLRIRTHSGTDVIRFIVMK